ncbi:MAG TPA: homocysteine S-methyltransferase family protein [Thermoleophilaceae bacterium]|nr:homocysteine S-methyltransferase family protein [Thermoleophilaceae bacterium]
MTSGHYFAELPISRAYERIDALLAAGDPVLLDGGVATELQQVQSEDRARRREPWGTWTLFQGPVEVLEVHRRYVDAGCDVISTNTWSVLEAADEAGRGPQSLSRNSLWLEAARLGMRLARQAIEEAGRAGETAAAFCINSSLLDKRATGRLELLSWLWHDEPPDLVILETLESIPDDVSLNAIQMVCETGLPVWVSFRRAREGMCSIDGDVRPDPSPEAFRASLEKLEQMGVRAVSVNCVPSDRVPDTIEYLRSQTSLPVGGYPNLGHSAGARWEFDTSIGVSEYARMASSWVDAGALIVGGCCGVTAKHLAGVRTALNEAALAR